MLCAVTLHFDLETDAAIRRLWQVIEDAGLPSPMINTGYRPHLSLAVCEQMELGSFKESIAPIMKTTPPIPLKFDHLGVFRGGDGVIFLGVTPNRTLIDFHNTFWEYLSPHMGGGPVSHYSPQNWVPHITLDYDLTPELVGQVTTVLLKTPLPVAGLATELVVTDPDDPSKVELYLARLGVG